MAAIAARTISVTNVDSESLSWTRRYSPFIEQDAQLFYRLRGILDASDVPTVGALESTLYPVRTHIRMHDLSFFADFFLPLTLNQAIRIRNIVIAVFATIAALIIDLVTLPIRIVTVIPRAIVNARKEEHALQRFLREQGVPSIVYDSGRVNVEVRTEYSPPENPPSNFVQSSSSSVAVHLIELPDRATVNLICN